MKLLGKSHANGAIVVHLMIRMTIKHHLTYADFLMLIFKLCLQGPVCSLGICLLILLLRKNFMTYSRHMGRFCRYLSKIVLVSFNTIIQTAWSKQLLKKMEEYYTG